MTTKIVATTRTTTLKTTDPPAVTVPHEDPRNTRESTTPNLPDVARGSIAVRGHVTPESETTAAAAAAGEGGGTGTETETETKIVRALAEAVNTRKRTRKRKRRRDARVLAVGPGRETKRTNPYQTSSLEK